MHLDVPALLLLRQLCPELPRMLGLRALILAILAVLNWRRCVILLKPEFEPAATEDWHLRALNGLRIDQRRL